MSRQYGILRCIIFSCAVTVSGIAELPRGYDQLVVSRTANAQVEQAAKDMAGLLQKTYGDEPRIRRQRMVEFGPVIHIGNQPDHPAFDDNPLTDDIVIERTGSGIVISGSDNKATCFAVYRFIQHFLGWYYFHPGPLGLERLDEPAEPPPLLGEKGILLHETAGFYSRNLSGIGPPGEFIDWSLWNGLRERFKYSHAVHRIITPDLFDDHPDWFAKDASGNPKRPPYDKPHGYNDHPDLSNPAVRAEVFQDFKDRITEVAGRGINPLAAGTGNRAPASYSLSLGDSFVFGHFPDEYPWKPHKYFRRWPDWSNHVFDFTNDVAQQVADYWNQIDWHYGGKPELYLGALSYLTWENPPDFDVHPWVVPYITYDRSQWYDTLARGDDLATVARWSEKQTKVLGTWDYLFGYGFLMPRSMSSIVADSIPSIYKLGVRAYYSQVVPVWPFDAHTTWLASQLLWDPDADAGDLLATFFGEYYGPARQQMSSFFELAEHTWMAQGEVRGWWLRYWKDPWQMALWDRHTLEKMEALLKEALLLTAAPEAERYNERILQTSRLFRATSLLFEYQHSTWELQGGDPAQAMRSLVLRDMLRETVAQVTESNPLARNSSDLSWIFRYDSTGGALFGLLKAEMVPPETVAAWCSLQGFSGMPDPDSATPVLFDTDFTHVENPRVWHQSPMDSEGAVMTMLPGGGGFLAADVRRGHLYQPFSAKPGHYYLGSLDVETRQSPTGEVYIRMDFFDTDRKLLSQSTRVRIAPTGSYGEKQALNVLAQAPVNASTGRLFIRFYEMDQGSQAVVTHPDVLDLGRADSP